MSRRSSRCMSLHCRSGSADTGREARVQPCECECVCVVTLLSSLACLYLWGQTQSTATGEIGMSTRAITQNTDAADGRSNRHLCQQLSASSIL